MTAPRPPTPSRRARQLLQRAHESVYRLPAGYPGFTATVEAHSERWTVRGTVDVHCPHGAVFLVDPEDPGHDRDALGSSRPSPAAITTVTTMIVDLVSRQFPKRFDELDGRFEAGFRSDLDQRGHRAIQLLGESRRTIRWLDDHGIVATAYRRAGVAHHLDVDGRHLLPDGRWLASRVRETRRAEGLPDQHQEWVDDVLEVDGVHVPLRRIVTIQATGGEAAPTPPGTVTIVLRDHVHHVR